MTFNTKKYNATRKKVLKFLEKNPESSQSIVLHGKAGTGKSRMLSELQLDFENNGYTCYRRSIPHARHAFHYPPQGFCLVPQHRSRSQD